MKNVRGIVAVGANGVRVEPLGPEHLDAAFALATDVFIQGSTLHRALNIGLDEYRTYLRSSFEQMIDEGLSVAAFDAKTEKMVGCLIATDFSLQFDSESDPTGKFAPLVALTRSLCQKYREKRRIGAGEVVLADMGVVHGDALGKGVYQQMRDALGQRAKAQGFEKILGELSSTATQHVVLKKLGHKNMVEIDFASFVVGGAYPFRSITEPRSIILAEGSL